MEPIERLRSYAEVHWEPWDASRNRLNESLDKIEQEIAERYMELPLDADGVPIHVGDKMEREGQQFIVCAVAPAVIHSWVAGRKLGEGSTTVGYRPEDCRHVKPHKLEDVLASYRFDAQNIYEDPRLDGNQRVDELEALDRKVADEIRELLGVSE